MSSTDIFDLDVNKIVTFLIEKSNEYKYIKILSTYPKVYPDNSSDTEKLTYIFTDIINQFISEGSKIVDSLITFDLCLCRIHKYDSDIIDKLEDSKAPNFKLKISFSNSLEILFPTDDKKLKRDPLKLSMFSVGKEDSDLLLKYITSLSNVYAFKNLPEEVIAVLMSYVSRSPYTFKENLLKLLKDEELNVNKLDIEKIIENFEECNDSAYYEGMSNDEYHAENKMLIEQLKNFNNNSELTKANEKASKFHEKWVLNYGHASCAELANIQFGIEQVSILASKELEDNRLGSYIEKSTRYVQFDATSYHIPEEFSSEDKVVYCDFMDYLFQMYNSLFPHVEKSLKNIYKQGEQSEKAFNSNLHAKACDILRYLLPTGTYTSVGVSMNARSASYAISKMLSSNNKELFSLGQDIHKELSKQVPTLLKYSKYNDYLASSRKIKEKLANEQSFLNRSPEEITKETNKCKLLDKVTCEDTINTLTASIYFRDSDRSYEEIINMCKYDLSRNYKIQTIEEFCGKRSAHQNLPREFESINLRFEIICDYGAFRDLQRHRMMTIIKKQIDTKFGYSWHSDLSLLPKEIQDAYEHSMYYAKSIHDYFSKKYHKDISAYVIPMAFNTKFVINTNLRQIVNLIELRSKSTGHESYRIVAEQLYHEIVDSLPFMKNIFNCNFDTNSIFKEITNKDKSKTFLFNRG